MKIEMELEDHFLLKKNGYTWKTSKVCGNEVIITVNPKDTFRQLRLTLKKTIRKIDSALYLAPRHHWHGRKGIYITLNVPEADKETIFSDLSPFLATLTRQNSGDIWHNANGSLWHDTWGEKDIPHRIQLVYLAKDPRF